MKYILSVVMVLFYFTSAYSDEVSLRDNKFSISAGLGLMAGHTTYQIGGHYDTPQGSGNVRFPLSELEFPLDVYIGTLNGTVKLNQKWKISVGLKKNITSESGKMKDSDWGIYYLDDEPGADPDSLDIYSESDTEVDLFIADIAARYYFNDINPIRSKFLFFIGGRYIYQEFDFDVSDLDQWYPSRPDRDHVLVSGKVLTYEVTKHVPALIIGTELFTKHNFSLEAELGYSPIVTVEDKDNHILRDKISKAKCDGDATLFSLAGSYNFHSRWVLELRFDYMSIDTKGDEKQYDEGEYSATIDQKNFSEIATYGLNIRYLF
jgi:outer membrane protease